MKLNMRGLDNRRLANGPIYVPKVHIVRNGGSVTTYYIQGGGTSVLESCLPSSLLQDGIECVPLKD